MGSMSLIHWVVVVAVVLILFGGGGKISSIMGDFARGIKSFKKNIADDESLAESNEPTGQITPPVHFDSANAPEDGRTPQSAQRDARAPLKK